MMGIVTVRGASERGNRALEGPVGGGSRILPKLAGKVIEGQEQHEDARLDTLEVVMRNEPVAQVHEMLMNAGDEPGSNLECARGKDRCAACSFCFNERSPVFRDREAEQRRENEPIF
jgi:hypothetical protein